MGDMTPASLIRRSLYYYWRTNLAVIAGVAIAVSVLSGALLVGDSVRGSLKDLFLGRLGRASLVLSGAHFFSEGFSSRIEHQPDFQKRFKVSPLIVTQAFFRFPCPDSVRLGPHQWPLSWSPPQRL